MSASHPAAPSAERTQSKIETKTHLIHSSYYEGKSGKGNEHLAPVSWEDMAIREEPTGKFNDFKFSGVNRQERGAESTDNTEDGGQS